MYRRGMSGPDGSPTSYRRRVVDDELDELLGALPAINIDGPKGVGKTATATQRAHTVFRLDDPGAVEVVAADPARMTVAPSPVLIDEWQRYQYSWDLVRRAVDDDTTPGRFLLTGSASPASPPTHSGAARIVSLRMRPMTLFERGLGSPTVSLSQLLAGGRSAIEGATTASLEDYVAAILTGGFPGMHASGAHAQRALLDSYLARIVDRDFPEAGLAVRNPAALTRWLTAYAAATATTATFETIRDAATPGQSGKPARSTTVPYRDTLERIWIADPVPAWVPTRNHLRRLTGGPKHHLADPALAAALLDVDADMLLSGCLVGPPIPRASTMLGSLFESLVALDLRVYAQATEAAVGHLRTKNGDHEIDFIVHGRGRRVVAIEAKLSATVEDSDVRHLHWLAGQLGNELVDSVVITTGREAYRRRDGIAIVPAALLGP
jgi:predicted AAA+ superfamily ATPase